ncbi:hypothetical protein QPK87_11390 [Kamptonema cortianum]|nr:hypothetical protein [Kamptonema cortianum]
MKNFARLYRDLDGTNLTNEKVGILAGFFSRSKLRRRKNSGRSGFWPEANCAVRSIPRF